MIGMQLLFFDVPNYLIFFVPEPYVLQGFGFFFFRL